MTSSVTAGEEPASVANQDASKRSPRHEAARELAAQRVPVFPCIAGDKIPATEHGFQNASTDLEQIDLWWAEADYNVAFSPEAAGLCVIDIDNEDTWKGLELEHGDVPTYAVRTPSGGLHLYYRGSLPSSASKLGKGIDTRGRGGYVLVPPSSVNGAPYTVKSALPYADIPDWIAPNFSMSRPARATSKGADLDHPASLERARARVAHYVARGDVAIEGQGGNDRTYRLAAELGDLGLSEAGVWEVIAPWNEACQPPWEDWELAPIIASAQRNRQNDIGCLADTETLQEKFGEAAAAFGVPADGKETTPGDERCALVDSYRGRKPSIGATRPPPVFWDEDGLFPRIDGGAIGFLYGPSGAHKSALILSRLMDLAMHHGVKVAYFAGEGANGVETRRIPALCQAFGKALVELDKVWLTIDRAADLNSPSDVAALIEAMADFRPDVIVTDTLAAALGALDENAAQTAALFAGNGAAVKIRKALNATCIYIAHTGKDRKRDIRGSSGFIANADFALRCTFDRDSRTVDLYVKKMRDGPAEFSVHHRVDRAASGVPIVRKMNEEERALAPRASAKHDQIKRDIRLAAEALREGGGSNCRTRVLAEQIVPLIKKETTGDRTRRVEVMARKLEGLVRPTRGTERPGPLRLWVERDQHNDIARPLRWDIEFILDGEEAGEIDQ
jgi:hypothetical protein